MIGYVWPETNASAAGLRDWALLEQFREAGWKVHYASPAKPNAFSEKLDSIGVPTFSCEANDSRFDHFVHELSPDVVLFDRFVTEEQFGWRVEENCPNAIRVLDTQDLHCLRRAREAALEAGWTLDRIQSPSPEEGAEMIDRFAREDLLRELSSIYRSDLTLVISSFEMRLLLQAYQVSRELLLLQRLSYAKTEKSLGFEERRDFVTIGNFRHPPNADSLQWLAREIWPEIRKRLPKAEMHVYGAYPSREAMAMTNAEQGFHVKGTAENQYETLRKYRVLLAPLRYGAGIKGKIADAWSVGTPVVTTPIGAEGMVDLTEDWPGEVALDPHHFVEAACTLYESRERWSERQTQGLAAVQRLYNPVSNGRILLEAIGRLRDERDERRRRNIIGSLLKLNQHRSTKYFSRWIELKQSIARQKS